MITTNDIERNIELSANEWQGITVLKSDHMRGIRSMAINTHGLCAACGESLANEEVNICHIVSAEHGKGIAPNNVYVGHKACNDFDREECKGDAFLIVASMAMPELILNAIPSRAEALAFLREYEKGCKARRAGIRRQARQAA